MKDLDYNDEAKEAQQVAARNDQYKLFLWLLVCRVSIRLRLFRYHGTISSLMRDSSIFYEQIGSRNEIKNKTRGRGRFKHSVQHSSVSISPVEYKRDDVLYNHLCWMPLFLSLEMLEMGSCKSPGVIHRPVVHFNTLKSFIYDPPSSSFSSTIPFFRLLFFLFPGWVVWINWNKIVGPVGTSSRGSFSSSIGASHRVHYIRIISVEELG